jgi:7-carboxy-7-deazaguanine synthase
MNTQQAEKHLSPWVNSLEVHSIFETIQGEGPYSGRLAIFIRLAGCNLRCPGCDTDYTSKRTMMDSFMILDFINKLQSKSKIIVLTGGEPFRQNIAPLVYRLMDKGYIVQLETNGTFPIPAAMITRLQLNSFKLVIVCSPKTSSINPTVAHYCKHFKYVLHHESINEKDGLPFQALGHPVVDQVFRPASFNNVTIYVQPEDSGDFTANYYNMEACKRSAFRHDYVVNLQLHKLLNVE